MAAFMDRACQSYMLKRMVDDSKLETRADAMIRARSEKAELKLAESYKSQNDKELDETFDASVAKLTTYKAETEVTYLTLRQRQRYLTLMRPLIFLS